MAEKIIKKVDNTKKNELVDELFEEVRAEVNEDEIKTAKLQIKNLLQQKAKAEKVVKNIDRQIEDLKLKIAGELL